MVGEAAMALSDHAVHLHQARGLGFVSSDKYVVRYGERERRTSAGGFVGASPGRARRHSLSGDGARVRPPSTPHKQASVDVSTHAERPPSSLPSAHQNPQWTRESERCSHANMDLRTASPISRSRHVVRRRPGLCLAWAASTPGAQAALLDPTRSGRQHGVGEARGVCLVACGQHPQSLTGDSDSRVGGVLCPCASKPYGACDGGTLSVWCV
jgi:hypothetical protein